MAWVKDELEHSTVAQALEALNSDVLKQYLALVPAKERPTRKSDIANLIASYLTGDRLRALWEQLNETQQLAVREAIYAADGEYNSERFKAKYGCLPVFGVKKDNYGYSETPRLLRLFNYGVTRYGASESAKVPANLKAELLSFVPPPPAAQLAVTAELPAVFQWTEKQTELEEDDEGITDIAQHGVYTMATTPPMVTEEKHEQEMFVREMEREAIHDLSAVLRLIDQAKFRSATRRASLPPRPKPHSLPCCATATFIPLKKRKKSGIKSSDASNPLPGRCSYKQASSPT